MNGKMSFKKNIGSIKSLIIYIYIYIYIYILINNMLF